MATFESGRESRSLRLILEGHAPIEGRLNRGKFAQYQIGDSIWLRRDYRDEYGVLHDGEERQALIRINSIRHYQSFYMMLKSEGYKRVIPYADSVEEAAAEFNRLYSTDEQAEYGVLAIESELVDQQ